MILPVFIFLVLAGTGLTRCGKRRAGRVLHACTLLLFIGVASGSIPAWLLQQLQSGYASSVPDWGRKNVIVVLGASKTRVGGNDDDSHNEAGTMEPTTTAYARLARSVVLYNACKKSGAECTIIVSGGDPQHYGVAEAVIYNAWLTQMGVPAIDLIPESDSLNTRQNAQFTSALLARLHYDRIVLITSAMHMTRSLQYFAYFGIHPTPVRADYLQLPITALPRAAHFYATDLALHEWLDIWRYRLYRHIGWREPAV